MNTNDFDLNLLAALEVLLAERSVTRAALRMGVTQPAMSNSLRRLRLLLDDPVFVRTPEGMQPTPRAVSIGPTIKHALDSIRASISAPGFDPQRSTVRFRVATLDYLEALHFPQVIARAHSAGPDIHVQIRRLEAIYEVPQQRLESGAIDCAVGLFPQPMTPQSGLHSQILRKEEWVCIARRGHPAFRRRLSLQDYAGLKHIGVAYPEHGHGLGMIDRLLAVQGLSRTCAASVPHFAILPFHVAQSDCIATVPRRIAHIFSKSLPLRVAAAPLPAPSDVSLIWHSRVDGDPAHRWFRNLLIESVR